LGARVCGAAYLNDLVVVLSIAAVHLAAVSDRWLVRVDNAIGAGRSARVAASSEHEQCTQPRDWHEQDESDEQRSSATNHDCVCAIGVV
jgi:hypothetical protein